jgi:large subunit ribosomal protein L22
VPDKTFKASHRHARMSPYKARPVIDLVRGKNVNDAISILEFQDRRSAPMIRKVIQSALANASNDLDVKLNRLVVTDARVDGGPLLGGRKRFMPRAMGRAFPIRKRTCHISVTLSEGPEPVRAKKKAGAAAGSQQSPATPVPAEGSAPAGKASGGGGKTRGAGKKE